MRIYEFVLQKAIDFCKGVNSLKFSFSEKATYFDATARGVRQHCYKKKAATVG